MSRVLEMNTRTDWLDLENAHFLGRAEKDKAISQTYRFTTHFGLNTLHSRGKALVEDLCSLRDIDFDANISESAAVDNRASDLGG